MKNFTQIITFISVAVIVIFTSIIGVFAIINSCENNQTTKDNKIIENTKHANDSIRIELKRIDKDKNEKIIEVKGLNNDSTYKLFKQLIAE